MCARFIFSILPTVYEFDLHISALVVLYKARYSCDMTPGESHSSNPSPSVIERSVDGSINFWDDTAELAYGYSRLQAVGSRSHDLLQTVFPCPLSDINDQLLKSQHWEGELIHTVKDGVRVKVLSRWQLYRDPDTGAARVREINDCMKPIAPETAYLSPDSRAIRSRYMVMLKWLCLPLAILATYYVFLFLTHELPVAPLLE